MSRNRLRLTLRQKVWRYRIEKWWWIIFVPVAYLTHLVNSVAVVSLLSIYALVITAGGAEQAAKAALEASDEETSEESKTT